MQFAATGDLMESVLEVDPAIPARTVCLMLGWSAPTLYRAIKAGRFPQGILVSPGCRRWRKSVVEDWLRRREVESTSDPASDGR